MTIRTILECDICDEEIHSEENDYIRAMPTEGGEMHFHHKCFQGKLNLLMQSSPREQLRKDFIRSIREGKFVGEVLGCL